MLDTLTPFSDYNISVIASNDKGSVTQSDLVSTPQTGG